MHSLHLECWMIHTFCKHYCFHKNCWIGVPSHQDKCWDTWWFWFSLLLVVVVLSESRSLHADGCLRSSSTIVKQVGPAPPFTLDDHVVVSGDVVLTGSSCRNCCCWDGCWAEASAEPAMLVSSEGMWRKPEEESCSTVRVARRALARVRRILEHQVRGREKRA